MIVYGSTYRSNFSNCNSDCGLGRSKKNQQENGNVAIRSIFVVGIIIKSLILKENRDGRCALALDTQTFH